MIIRKGENREFPALVWDDKENAILGGNALVGKLFVFVYTNLFVVISCMLIPSCRERLAVSVFLCEMKCLFSCVNWHLQALKKAFLQALFKMTGHLPSLS